MFRDTHHGKPCKYCLRPMSSRDGRLHPTRDHVNPRARGGGPVVVACATCNTIKADMIQAEWNAFMASHPQWWLLSRLELRNIMRQTRGLSARRRRTRGTSIVVPKELIYGHRKEGNTDRVAAMVEAPAQVETRFLEERTRRSPA